MRRADWLWDGVRGPYELLLRRLGGRGLRRAVNGTDVILLAPECRNVLPVAARYEPELWRAFIGGLRQGDVVVDVGAFVGLYTVAAAKRVGPVGRVLAFEPDPANFLALCRHVRLNDVGDRVTAFQAAVGEADAEVLFQAGRGPESHVVSSDTGAIRVPVVRLDSVLRDGAVNVLKIDVEGYELAVLEGCAGLLADSHRRPRAIYVELHPHGLGGSGESARLFELLAQSGYHVSDLGGRPVGHVSGRTWIAAFDRRRAPA